MPKLIRTRWEFEAAGPEPRSRQNIARPAEEFALLAAIEQVVGGRGLTSHFQPIYSARDGSVFGFEALARLLAPAPFTDTGELFKAAYATGSICALDALCLESAFNALCGTDFSARSWYLFVNICPETLMNPDLSLRRVYESAVDLLIPCSRIVLEITEEGVISNYRMFRDSLDFYRRQGFKVAIDDFGAGYAGLKMLSTIEPDFIKIDRHFIADIDRALINANLVEAVTTACNRIGIKVIAEGVERPEEFTVLSGMGIEYLQGYLFNRPGPSLDDTVANLARLSRQAAPRTTPQGKPLLVGEIVNEVEPLELSERIIVAFRRFLDQPGLPALPVVDRERVVGMLNRSRFLEDQIIGFHGYAYSMNSTKLVRDVMERNILFFEANTPIEEAAEKINAKGARCLNDNIVVLKNGRYRGLVDVHLLVETLMELSVMLAKDSNPLSGLPGNNAIQREISTRLAGNNHFDVLYVDIDHFKPYNDHYGFEKGDTVIRALAGIIQAALESFEDPFNFTGHIGGDDFILVTRPAAAIPVAESIIAGFAALLPEFHGPEDFAACHYLAPNRQGQTEWFPLLSLSVAIASTEVYKIDSYPQLSSIACELKKAAKQQAGSSIARDQRKRR